MIGGVMLFEIRSIQLSSVVCAGVHTFTAPLGYVILPKWMMSTLQVKDDERVGVNLTSLPNATFSLFQPLDSQFLSLPNPRVILEKSLRQFPCLTKGSIIAIEFNQREYRLKILKTQPADAVCTLHADVICDFAPPVSEFDHHWDTSDTDSASDEALMTFEIGRTLRGDVVMKDPRPIRSTLEQRERERRERPPVAGVTQFVAGQPIPPPKPPEDNNQKGKAFHGVGRTVKKAKNQKGSAPQRVESAPLQKPTDQAFVGVPRTLGGKIASRTAVDGTQQVTEGTRRESGSFQGAPRRLGKE
jgi:ubiquitin fusion degradation protein 1